ncbi:MAG: AAA family ATPase, partial [Candidatus Sumerlaeota bacterium]|nr:AAA family ATPase [Candidatus Sumerlaeota bacterium]
EGTAANVPPGGGRKHPHQEYISLNTTNILFICGGAFTGLDKIIDSRMSTKTLGFGAEVLSRNDRDIGQVLSQVTVQDLLKFGFIPEFIGRMPVISTLSGLKDSELVRILVEPRNAIIRQYQKFFEMEGVELSFTPEALNCIAKNALSMDTGARALRSILEHVMLDLMYDLPSRSAEIGEVRIDADVITRKAQPVYIERAAKQSA